MNRTEQHEFPVERLHQVSTSVSEKRLMLRHSEGPEKVVREEKNGSDYKERPIKWHTLIDQKTN